MGQIGVRSEIGPRGLPTPRPGGDGAPPSRDLHSSEAKARYSPLQRKPMSCSPLTFGLHEGLPLRAIGFPVKCASPHSPALACGLAIPGAGSAARVSDTRKLLRGSSGTRCSAAFLALTLNCSASLALARRSLTWTDSIPSAEPGAQPGGSAPERLR